MRPFDAPNLSQVITASLSIVGCTFVLVIFAWTKWKKPQELVTFRLYIFWSTLTELLLSIIILVQAHVAHYDVVNAPACAFSMFVWFWMQFATLAFSCAMAHHLLLVFVMGQKNPNHKIYIGWVVFSWVGSLVVALLPFTMNMYGYDPVASICYLKDFGSRDMYIWEWCTHTGWMLLACAYVFVVTIVVIHKMFSNRYKGKEGSLPMHTVVRLMLYPINMLIATLPNTITVISISAGYGYNSRLFLAGGLTLASQGWLDSILFCFDPLVALFFSWLLPCCNKGKVRVAPEGTRDDKKDKADNMAQQIVECNNTDIESNDDNR